MGSPFLVGSVGSFAVQYELESPVTDEDRYWWFGTLSFRLRSFVIGKTRERTTMTTLRGAVPDILRNRGRRQQEALLRLPAKEAFDAIYQPLCVDTGQPLEEVERAARELRRFDVIPSGVDVFDGWRAYLVEGGLRGRYLWRGPDEAVHEAWLKAGEVDDTLEAFWRDLCRRTGWELG